VRFIFGLAIAVVVASCAPAEAPDIRSPVQEPTQAMLAEAATAFHTLRDGFLEWYYEAKPVRASELGVRTHDAQLPGMDRAAIQRRIDALLDWDARLRRIPIRLMRDGDRADYAVMEFGIRGELLELEEVRRWALDPGQYTGLIRTGLTTLVEQRPSGEDRTAALRSRLSASPAVLAAARTNLRSPPRPWTEYSIEAARALLAYVEALPELLAREAGGAAVASAVEAERGELESALREHVAWLESDVLAASTGEFRLGRYLFSRKLLYEEHLDLTLPELDRLNEAAITEHRGRLDAAARAIDPGRTPRAILDSIGRQVAAPETLVPVAQRAMGEAREWVVSAGVVTIPGRAVPEVREAFGPPRPGVGTLRAPGPFDPIDAPAYFEIHSPDPAWAPAQTRLYLRSFHEPAVLGAALHETFPGRYVQRLHQAGIPSDIRRVFLPRTLTGGWAHYAEAMAIDEGFRADDPAVRLAQSHRALQRHARWHAALHLHAFGRTAEQVLARFVEISLLDDFRAGRELQEITRDPMALADALGGMQIAELRRAYGEYLSERDEEFSLAGFHDQLLRFGLPVPLATEALMPPPPVRQPRAQRPLGNPRGQRR
jgi:hypothetical protein